MDELTLDDVSIGYGYPPVMTNVHGELKSGEWVHLFGNNGVGKTTLLKVLATLKKPLSGEIRWNSDPLVGLDRDRYRRKIRYVAHDRALFQDLSVRDNWTLFSSLFDLSGTSDAQLAGDFSRERAVRQLSEGERHRVELSTLWPNDRSIIIMDEPFSSLDPDSREILRSFLSDQRDDGRLVVTASPGQIKGPDRYWELTKEGVSVTQ